MRCCGCSREQPECPLGTDSLCISQERNRWQRRTCKACAIDVLYTMIRNQKPFLPPHEHCTTVPIVHRQMWFLQFMLDMSEGRETLPMDHVLLFVCTPVLCQKSILVTDDLCIKIRGELGPVVCQTSYAKITAKERGCKIDVLHTDI